MPNEPVDASTTGPGAPGEPDKGIALCLSGGGFRAMLFHLGAICDTALRSWVDPAIPQPTRFPNRQSEV